MRQAPKQFVLLTTLYQVIMNTKFGSRYSGVVNLLKFIRIPVVGKQTFADSKAMYVCILVLYSGIKTSQVCVPYLKC